MRILAKCPGCNGRIELDIQSLDRRQQCESCGRLFKVPDAQQLHKALKVVKEAGQTVFVDEDGRVYG
jgi:transcriptional regulator NrdR family protein